MFAQFVNSLKTPVGIGIDCVRISELRKLDERTRGAFVDRTFSVEEKNLADASGDRWSFLSGRFAVKEAAFKALAHLTDRKHFDFRKVETLTEADGSPYIVRASIPDWVWTQAEVDSLLVSVTGEGDFALAVVQAVRSAK